MEDESKTSQELNLKPCPFCGSADVVTLNKNNELPAFMADWVVECVACDIAIIGFSSATAAAEAWNRRGAPLSAETERPVLALVERIISRAKEVVNHWNEFGPEPQYTLEGVIDQLAEAIRFWEEWGRTPRPESWSIGPNWGEWQVIKGDVEAGVIPDPFDYDEEQAERDEELYNQTVTCEICGGEIGDGWSTCTCDDDDDPADNERLDLGPCCACLEKPATGVVLLQRLAPVPGTGWGCFQCGLPANGAIAVICGDCGDSGAELKEVVAGQITNQGRMAITALLPEVFEHDPEKHPEYDWDNDPANQPLAPPPDEAETTRVLVDGFARNPWIEIELSTYEAFTLAGLLELCLRHPGLTRESRQMAEHLARAFEEIVSEAVPEAAPLFALGRDPRYDVPYKDEKPLGPDPDCPNCDGTGGPLPGGRCGLCWIRRENQGQE